MEDSSKFEDTVFTCTRIGERTSKVTVVNMETGRVILGFTAGSKMKRVQSIAS